MGSRLVTDNNWRSRHRGVLEFGTGIGDSTVVGAMDCLLASITELGYPPYMRRKSLFLHWNMFVGYLYVWTVKGMVLHSNETDPITPTYDITTEQLRRQFFLAE